MDVNDAFQAAIPLGRTQMVILLATILMNMETGMTMLGNVFLARKLPFRCSNRSGFTLEESVPMTAEGLYATCEEYAYPGSASNETRDCAQWEFDTEIAGKSIVSDWSLVCGKDALPGLAQTLIMAGFGIGSIVGGPIADKFGRRKTIIVALILFNALGILVSVVQSYALFAILRFLLGAVFKAVRIPMMNLLFESLVPKHRAFFGVIPTAMSSVALMMMAGIAFLIRDWRYLNIVLMIPAITMMLFSWLLPESVRWLLTQNRREEAEQTMQKIAAFNKAEGFPSPALETKEDKISEGEGREIKTKAGVLSVMVALFKMPTLTVTLVLSINWNTGTAVVHLIGNIGGLLAPQLLFVNKYVRNFSSFVILGCCFSSTLLCLLLPETVGYKQPENTDDLQKLFDNNRLIRCGGAKNHRRSQNGADDNKNCQLE